MISLLIISHSDKIASGVKELILDMLPKIDIYVVGGTDENKIGTSFTKILAEANKIEGKEILLFYDLGSSLINAELIKETIEKPVTIVDVPLVEGAFLAANEIMNKKTLSEIKIILEKEFSLKR